MDPSLNNIPEKVSSIHLIAVCGTAMGALACMLKDLGYAVTGSDNNVYPPMSTFLERKGIDIVKGFNAENISFRPDLVVVGNAISADNPEAMAADRMGLNYCSLPQALNRFAAEGKQSVVITGTHGKTTTSSMAAWVFNEAGLDPSYMIGGIVRGFDSNYRLSKGPVIVFEGDEYDTAFFDKGPKFLHFDPKVAVLTSIEFDHADIYRDLDHVKKAFRKMVSAIRPDSTLIAKDDDANIEEIVSLCPGRVLRYGRLSSSDWRLGEVTVHPPTTRFEVFRKDTRVGRFEVPVMGEHNLQNALAVIAAAHEMGISDTDSLRAFSSFPGVRRRQEIRGVKSGVTVMDDFAHHPTAVRETVAAVKSFYPDRRLIAVFEPRTNSSMRSVFQSVYPAVFDPADVVCIRKPSLLSKIPEGERFSSEQLVDDLKARGKDARFFEETEPIVKFVTEIKREGDIVLVMSNGGFDNIHERLLSAL